MESEGQLLCKKKKNSEKFGGFAKKHYLCTRVLTDTPAGERNEESRIGACGGIGRRARLRIWFLTKCRFESCQAH